MGGNGMADAKKDRFLIAASEATAGKLAAILSAANIEAETAVHTGAEVIDLCAQDGALILTTYCLPDMAGAELAQQLGEGCDVLMIVPQDFDSPVPANVLTLRNPLSPDALVQAVRVMLHCRDKIAALQKKADKLSRTLEERKIIDRAKGRLMDALHLTEAQAHHHIQKKSMDSGRRIVDVAREILEAESIEA